MRNHRQVPVRAFSYWLDQNFRLGGEGDRNEVTGALKVLDQVRKIRQRPAHEIGTNLHGIQFYKMHDR